MSFVRGYIDISRCEHSLARCPSLSAAACSVQCSMEEDFTAFLLPAFVYYGFFPSLPPPPQFTHICWYQVKEHDIKLFIVYICWTIDLWLHSFHNIADQKRKKEGPDYLRLFVWMVARVSQLFALTPECNASHLISYHFIFIIILRFIICALYFQWFKYSFFVFDAVQYIYLRVLHGLKI